MAHSFSFGKIKKYSEFFYKNSKDLRILLIEIDIVIIFSDIIMIAKSIVTGANMKSITIRGIDPFLESALEKTAKTEHKSVNKTILTLLRKALGIDEPFKYQEFHDIDHLAGTWVKEDEDEFNRATAQFYKIEEELWK